MIPTIFYRPEIKKAVRNHRNGRPALPAEGDSADAEKTGKPGQKEEKRSKRKKKRLSGDDMELAILDMMKSQQEAIQR